MGYQIKPVPIKLFIEDPSIKLPRFQRKQTWNEVKNFQLTISVFKSYPLGVTILSLEKDGENETRWLLDGRQRKTALKELYEDPEKIYFWGKKFLKFSQSSSPSELQKIFLDKISEYIEDSEETTERKNSDQNSENVQSQDETEDRQNQTGSLNSVEQLSKVSDLGLQNLFDIIELAHQERKGRGLVAPFDFTTKITNLPYFDDKEGIITCKKIKKFIAEYYGEFDDRKEAENKENFTNYLAKRLNLKTQEIKSKIGEDLNLKWDRILKIMKLFDKLDANLMKLNIGVIELENISTTDQQKIFNIINTGGTQLTAAEILSAKPSWNKRVENPSEELLETTKKLYGKIGIPNEGVVKWDVPATFSERINNFSFFFNTNSNNQNKSIENGINYGFKLLSAILVDGVRKEDFDKLVKIETLKKNQDIDKLINSLNLFIKLLKEDEFFGKIFSWKKSISDIIGENTAMTFLSLAFRNWRSFGENIGNHNAKKTKKNAFVLFDRLVYEYLTNQWKGSSDAKVSKYLNELTKVEKFENIDEEKWTNLITEVIEQYSVAGSKIEDYNKLFPLLFYNHVMNNEINLSYGNLEIDHIIPQTAFDNSRIDGSKIIQNGLFNLVLIPEDLNIRKKNKPLNNLNNNDRSLYSKLSNIALSDFEKFSEINNYNDLKTQRSKHFLETFINRRRKFLNSY
jgi:hypothetical protein